MKQLKELLETGQYDSYVPTKRMTVRELIDELGLKANYFGILVDDKKATIDTVITPESKVVIIPRIAGGSQVKIIRKGFEEFDKEFEERINEFLANDDHDIIEACFLSDNNRIVAIINYEKREKKNND